MCAAFGKHKFWCPSHRSHEGRRRHKRFDSSGCELKAGSAEEGSSHICDRVRYGVKEL